MTVTKIDPIAALTHIDALIPFLGEGEHIRTLASYGAIMGTLTLLEKQGEADGKLTKEAEGLFAEARCALAALSAFAEMHEGKSFPEYRATALGAVGSLKFALR